MTPQEKAKELYDKYHEEFIGNWDLGINDEFSINSFCKKASLIAVNEIFELSKNGTFVYGYENYWEQVKQEIENL